MSVKVCWRSERSPVQCCWFYSVRELKTDLPRHHRWRSSSKSVRRVAIRRSNCGAASAHPRGTGASHQHVHAPDEFGTYACNKSIHGTLEHLQPHRPYLTNISLSLSLSLSSAMAFSQLRSSEITYRALVVWQSCKRRFVRKISDPAALEELMKDLSAFVAGNHISTCSCCASRTGYKLTLFLSPPILPGLTD